MMKRYILKWCYVTVLVLMGWALSSQAAISMLHSAENPVSANAMATPDTSVVVQSTPPQQDGNHDKKQQKECKGSECEHRELSSRAIFWIFVCAILGYIRAANRRVL